MTTYVLLFFGATLIYSAILTMDRDITIGFTLALVGVVLIVWPLVHLLKPIKIRFGGTRNLRIVQGPQKKERRSPTDQGNEKTPTYH